MILSKQDINNGRQKEFDYLKGLFVPMIILIHAFQLMGATNERFYEFFYPICTLTGSTIFLFVMGLGSTYSKRTDKQMVISGLKLIVCQIAWNVFALAIPFLLGQAVRAVFGLSMDTWPVVLGQSVILLQYINIFFIAGVSYLLLALFKRIHIPTGGYLAVAMVFLMVTPFLYMTDFTTGLPIVDYIFMMFCGGRESVSLIFWPHFVYTLFGVWFGRILKRVVNKHVFYMRIVLVGFVIGIAYVVYVVMISETITEFCNYMSYTYIFPGTVKMCVNLAWTLIAAAVFYWLIPWIKKIKWLDRILQHFNNKTTAYYAIHPFLFSFVTSLVALKPLGWMVCVIVAVVNIIFSWFIIWIWEKIRICK